MNRTSTILNMEQLHLTSSFLCICILVLCVRGVTTDVTVIPGVTQNSQCDVTDTLVTCTKIRNVGCCISRGGTESGLDVSHEDPEAPVKLKADILEDEIELPRLNITWAGPQSGASISALTGFRIIVNKEVYTMRFNTSIKQHMRDLSEGVFNFTSHSIDYQSKPIKIQVTGLPIPKDVFHWKQVNTTVNLTRNAEIDYFVNSNNTAKCEINVRVKDKYIGSCNTILLVKCNSVCETGHIRIQDDQQVFNSDEWVALTVKEVPALYILIIKPSAVERNRCLSSKDRGAKNRTLPFRVEGNSTNCYIVEKSPKTQKEEKEEEEDVSTTTEDSPASSALVRTGGVEDGPDKSLPKILTPVLVTLSLVIVGIVATVLYCIRCSYKAKKQDKNNDPFKCAGFQNGMIPNAAQNVASEKISVIKLEETTRAIILNFSLTSTHCTIQWLPLMSNDKVTKYCLYLYDQDNMVIEQVEKQQSTEKISVCIPLMEETQKVRPVLVTVYSDHEADEDSPFVDYGDFKTVPLPVEIGKKTVLLIYTDDCEHHEEAVTELARLLHASNCEVKFERWDGDSSVDRRRWYEECIRKADKVVLIHSKGTGQKYDAYVTRKQIEDNPRRTHGDTFCIALDLLLNHLDRSSKDNETFRAKLRHVFLSYTKPDDLNKSATLINRAATYRIMDNLVELILSLHDLPPSSPQSDYIVPGLDHVAINRLEGAIENATRCAECQKCMNSKEASKSNQCDSGIDIAYVSSNGSYNSSIGNYPTPGTSSNYFTEDNNVSGYSQQQTNTREYPVENTYIPPGIANDFYPQVYNNCGDDIPTQDIPSQRPQLSALTMRRTSSDLYSDMSTPDMPTKLSPNPLPLILYPPRLLDSDSDSQSDT